MEKGKVDERNGKSIIYSLALIMTNGTERRRKAASTPSPYLHTCSDGLTLALVLVIVSIIDHPRRPSAMKATGTDGMVLQNVFETRHSFDWIHKN
jgi:hypothetical protein